ncbi:MAG: gamma-glutamylcyclotransferase [Proteobacteria bacterium]|nr:gamma-glutamylcyclotransferase [Pseudomonadota bacterium]
MINEKLLAETTAAAPAGDLYVFTYGSLMWRPEFRYQKKQPARVFGYSRRCAVFSYYYRGTPEQPGLVLGLDVGGSCNGLCYRVAAAQKAQVTRYLFKREMFADVYYPRYVRVRLPSGKVQTALTFVVRREGSQYAAPMADPAAVKIIRRAAGVGGANSEYFHSTRHHLQEVGSASPLLERLCALLTE